MATKHNSFAQFFIALIPQGTMNMFETYYHACYHGNDGDAGHSGGGVIPGVYFPPTVNASGELTLRRNWGHRCFHWSDLVLGDKLTFKYHLEGRPKLFAAVSVKEGIQGGIEVG